MATPKGLLLIASTKKPSASRKDDYDDMGDEESPDSEPSSGAEDMALERAFKAATDGDEAAFKKGMKAAMSACYMRLRDEE